MDVKILCSTRRNLRATKLRKVDYVQRRCVFDWYYLADLSRHSRLTGATLIRLVSPRSELNGMANQDTVKSIEDMLPFVELFIDVGPNTDASRMNGLFPVDLFENTWQLDVLYSE